MSLLYEHDKDESISKVLRMSGGQTYIRALRITQSVIKLSEKPQ